MSDAFAEYVKSQYDNADRNRRDLQSKWERNRLWFNGGMLGQSSSTDSDQWKHKEGQGWRSKTFPGTTHSKVMSAFVICLDTVLAGGKIPFMLKPSPMNKRMGLAMDGESIQASIDAMTDLIAQQFADCNADRHLAKNLLSEALYGETYAKMGVKRVTRSGWEQAMPVIPGVQDLSRVQVQGQWKKWKESLLAPAWYYITVWDIFRDWEADDLSECAFIIHRQITDNYWLRGRMGKPFFNDEVIQRAIERQKSDKTKSSPSIAGNSDTSNVSPAQRDMLTARARNRQNLEYWGRIPRKVAEEYEKSLQREDREVPIPSLASDNDSDGDEVEVHGMVMEGEDTIRYVRTDVEMRPFAHAQWEENCDEWASRGVADNCHEMSVVQRGTFRGIEDNTKLTGNSMLAVKRRLIKNMPKQTEPGLFVDLDETCDDVRKAIQPIQQPDASAGLVRLFEMAGSQLEEDSMIPRIAQGQLEATDQTAKEASIRQAQSLKYIGMAVRNNDNLIEDMVGKFYDYNMNDPAVEEGKGNYIAQALGFSSFQNKTERLQNLNMILNRALESEALAGETKIRDLWAEILKGLDIDSDQMLKSDEEKQMEAMQQAQNPAANLQTKAVEAVIEKDAAAAVKSRASAVKDLADAKATTEQAHLTMDQDQAPSLAQAPVEQPTQDAGGLQ